MNCTPAQIKFIETRIIPSLQKLNYVIYKDGKLNIVSIRNRDKAVNVFNDRLFLFSYENGNLVANTYIITTEPGLPTLQTPQNIKGAAILVEGQYIDTYAIDIHARNNKRFAHEALCQRLNTVKVFRDNNRDSVYDYNIGTIDTGWFGINIHRASGTRDVTEAINSFSAGCQVFKSNKAFADFMKIVKSKREVHNNRYTYTLLTEKQVI